MARRQLNDDEKEKAATKEWKKPTIFTNDETKAYKARNLTGPKTVEGKMRSLANLRAGRAKHEMPQKTHGGYIRNILNEDEAALYESRKEVYLKDFTDFNESSDGMILHQVLMDEVIYFRLMKYWADHPSQYDKLERPISECNSRITRNLDALGTLRKQRLKQDDRINAISIASIAQQFYREMMGGNLQEEIDAQAEEEKAFLEQKKQRDRSNIYEADYELVDQEVMNNESETE